MDAENKTEERQTKTPKIELIDGGIGLNDPLRPYIQRHNFQYDFTYLKHPILHPQVARDMAHAFALRLSKLNSPKGKNSHHSARRLKKFFVWLFEYLDSAKQTDFKQSVKTSLREGRVPERDDWQEVMNALRVVIYRTKNNPLITSELPHCQQGVKDQIKSFLDMCTTRGLLPYFILKGKKGARGDKTGKKKILSDFATKKLSEKDIERLLGGYLTDRVNRHDIIEEERAAAIKALVSTGLDIKGLSDAEIVQEIYKVNKTRLEDLRRCAEADFIKGWKAYQEGQDLLDSCDLSYKDDISEPLEDYLRLISEGKNGHSKEIKYHPISEMFLGEFEYAGNRENRRVRLPEEIFLPRVLTLIEGRYGKHGRTVKYPLEKPLDDLFLRLWEQQYGCHKLGYQSWVRERLGASIDTLYAALLILLVDLGFNVAVVEALTVDCVRDTDDPSIKQVWGIKVRANNKRVEAYVRINDPGHKINSVEVIRRVEEMTKRFRRLVSVGNHPLYKITTTEPDLVNRLFIREFQVNEMAEELEAVFSGGLDGNIEKSNKRFKARWPQIGAYEFAPGSIRVTVNILKFMDGDSVETVKTSMEHESINTTSGYVMRSMSRMAMEQQIREFQNNYEVIMISDIEGAAEKLGYTVKEYTECLEAAERTGLGSLCFHIKKDEDGKFVSEKRKDCDPIEDCPECPLTRVFPALKENLVDAFLMHNWIKENQEKLIVENEKRYRKVWLRWLAICAGVIDKAKTAHNINRTKLNEAENLAQELLAGGFLPYQ